MYKQILVGGIVVIVAANQLLNEHGSHLHTHQEAERPFYGAFGLAHIALSTSASTATIVRAM